MDKNPKKKEPGRPGSPRTASRPKAKSWEMPEKLPDEFTRAVLTAFPEDAQELLALRAADREARRAVLCDAQAILDGDKSARRAGIRNSEDENAGRELYQLAEALICGAPPPALRTISARKFLAHLNDAREKAEALAAAAQRVLEGDLSGAKAEAAEPVKWYLAGNCWRDWQAWLIRTIRKMYELPDEALRKHDLVTLEWEKRQRETLRRLRALYKEISALRAQAEAADNPAERERLNAICEKKAAETRELIEQAKEPKPDSLSARLARMEAKQDELQKTIEDKHRHTGELWATIPECVKAAKGMTVTRFEYEQKSTSGPALKTAIWRRLNQGQRKIKTSGKTFYPIADIADAFEAECTASAQSFLAEFEGFGRTEDDLRRRYKLHDGK